MLRVWHDGDWRGLLVELMRPMAERMFLAGAVHELLIRDAVLPAQQPLTSLVTGERSPHFHGVKQTWAEERLRQLGIRVPEGITFELPVWMQDKMTEAVNSLMLQDYWQAVGDQARGDMAQVLETGLIEGQSIRQIRKAIETKIPEYSRIRAELVARTEVAGLQNAGALGVIDETYVRTGGLVDNKVWMSVLDERTRPAHAEADGQEVGLRQFFVVGGERCQYPGDPSLSPGNRIQCRCCLASGDVYLEAVE